LQTVALLAMEPPISDSADAYRDEEVKVLRQAKPLDPADTVGGQYVGYLDAPDVAPESATEPFVATTTYIDSWGCAGAPDRRPPRLLFAGSRAGVPEANRLHFRLGHSDGVTMKMQAKVPGQEMRTQEVALDVDFRSALGHRREAYERLLSDAMLGRRHRFARE